MSSGRPVAWSADQAPGQAGRCRPVDLAAVLSDRSCPSLGMPVVSEWGASDDGEHRRVALVDAAVDGRHPDLAGARMISWGHADTLLARDTTGHATACASLLVGQGRRDVAGLVPAATLLVAPVFCSGATDIARRASAAIRWAVDNDADTIVLPFGRMRSDRRLAGALTVAASAGVVLIAAAGNLGHDRATFPGRHAHVLAVTAHDDHKLIDWCSHRADLAAPGRCIPAAGQGGPTHLDGTSVAAVLAAAASRPARSAAGRAPLEPRRDHA